MIGGNVVSVEVGRVHAPEALAPFYELLLIGVLPYDDLKSGKLRPGMAETPMRAAKALMEMTSGYEVDVPSLLKEFDDGGENYDQMVIVKGIEFTSLCEHHLLPFYGVAHVAYLPNGKVYGLSKIARVVDAFARRFQVQERMTAQIAEAVFGFDNQTGQPRTKGAACVVKAKHMCMGCRGILKPDAETVTSNLRGEFMQPEVRAEMLALIGTI